MQPASSSSIEKRGKRRNNQPLIGGRTSKQTIKGTELNIVIIPMSWILISVSYFNFALFEFNPCFFFFNWLKITFPT